MRWETACGPGADGRVAGTDRRCRVAAGDRPGFGRRALGTVIGLAQLATDGRNHHLLPGGGRRLAGSPCRSRNCGMPPVRTA